MAEAREFPKRILELVPFVSDGVATTMNDEGFAEIRIPRPRTRWIRFLCFIFRLPDHKILVLDETGTEVLGRIDGQRTFRDLARHLEEARSLAEPEALSSTAAFLKRLADERAISFEGSSGEAAPVEEGSV